MHRRRQPEENAVPDESACVAGAERPFSGQVVVITGAGSGLGRAMAMEFFWAGACVAALDLDSGGAEQTAAAITQSGGAAAHFTVDVADPGALSGAARAVQERFGGCHVLCANVGVQQFGALDRLTYDDWRWVLDVNVLGMVNTVSTFLPLIRQSTGSRHIMLTSSSGVHSPGVRLGAYTTSKFAVMGYGETLRMELDPEDIGVSVLFPAGMMTRHLESSAIARPAERGPSVTLPDDIEAMMASRDMTQDSRSVVTAEVAVRNLLAELATNPPYIVTHGSYLDDLQQRHADLVSAYERGQQSLPD
jgi:NAD(P)-dependent dehydrogenase (short-subunit alcohol dehydrogenase family)